MIKSFTQFVSEELGKTIVFTLGRFNPPSVGHEKLLNQTAAIAAGGQYRIYVSSAHDEKKNPLPFESKVKWARKMFPRQARNIVDDDVSNVLQICSKLYDQGFTSITLVVGDDRVTEFETVIQKYNGVQNRDGFYNFKTVKVVSIGSPDPDSEGLMGMSSSKMRNAAIANDLESFSKGVPVSFNDTEELFNDVRHGLGLKESKNFRKHVQLAPVSTIREAYVAGALFQVGNSVVIKESEQVGKITHCGPNYLIVEMTDGSKLRKWLTDVELVEATETPEWVPFSPTLHTLAIPREKMPQIRQDDRPGLLRYLKEKGVVTTPEQIDPTKLRPTQAEYSPAKVAKAVEVSAGTEKIERPILASLDGHIVDGHHQWMAQLQNGTQSVNIIRFNVPIQQALNLALEYPKSFQSNASATVKEGLTVSKVRKLIKNEIS